MCVYVDTRFAGADFDLRSRECSRRLSSVTQLRFRERKRARTKVQRQDDYFFLVYIYTEEVLPARVQGVIIIKSRERFN